MIVNVEFSLAKKRFLEVPSRIQMLEAVGNRRTTLVRYYTFLSSRGCEWFLEDLKTRALPPVAKSLLVTAGAFKEADRMIHKAGVRWHGLRDYFHACFMRHVIMSSPPHIPTDSVDFMLGHVVKVDDLSDAFRFFGNPKVINLLRQAYVEVEKQSFV